MFLTTWINLNDPLLIKITLTITLMITILFKMHKSKPSKEVYLVNFVCFKPKKSQQMTREYTIERTIYNVEKTSFTKESLGIIRKMLMGSGIGDATYVPEALLKDPPDISMNGARLEAEAALFGTIDSLLALTGVKTHDIGVLVVNCSVFSPVPSLTSMIVNKYKLRDDVKAYCLSGMGCSASVIAIDLARQLLQVHTNTYAIVISAEVIGQNYYTGNDTQKLSINSVMRVGGAAMLLSNHFSDQKSSKYQLIHSVRTNTSSSDISYGCVFHEEDPQGHLGVTVTKELLVAAKNTVKIHLVDLGQLILPIGQKLKFTTNYLAYKLNKLIKLYNVKPYTPNFGQVVDHFFPHVGGVLVIDVMEKTLKINVEAARMTLYRFGNTSSSSIWYELAYAEAKGKVKRGHSVCQLGFGSGFKCNSLIWKALKDVDDHEEHNPWSQEIDNISNQLEDFGQFPFGFR